MLQATSGEGSDEQAREIPETLFVVNLSASTTPVALAHPDNPELKRFTFFVTRRREEGRERFRLHMGYFATQEQAEAMLSLVRDVYPGAWAGPAPENRASGKIGRRRKLAVVQVATPAMEEPAAKVPAAAPVVEALVVATPAAVAPAKIEAASVPASQPIVEAPLALLEMEPVAPPVVAAAPVAVPAPAAEATKSFELELMSNVREVLAQLADGPASPVAPRAPEKVAPAPVIEKQVKATPAPGKALLPPPAVVPTVHERRVGKPAPVAAPTVSAPTVAKAPATLTPAQTLAVLEPVAKAAAVPVVAQPPVAAPAPRALSVAEQLEMAQDAAAQAAADVAKSEPADAPASFAVQLMFAVQPIDMDALPHLAIFDAYTLYHVEGHRQGRRWYGLRLGFFSDANSAQQVAHYVRSEYAAVAVVPVTGKEKTGASAPAASAESAQVPTLKPPAGQAPAAKRDEALQGFELLPDQPAAAKRDLDDAIGASANGAAKSPPKATGTAPGKRAVARPQMKPSPPGAPQPLESTLEMLGASTLTIDESREIITDSAIRKTREPKKSKAGAFSRLLSRLSDKR